MEEFKEYKQRRDMEFEEYKQTRDKIYLAYLEEKCHIHPTADVEFKVENFDTDSYHTLDVITVRIGGFDCGITFTDGDILTWFIENDIKSSEVKDYTAPFNPAPIMEKVAEEIRDELKNHTKDTDIATVHDVTDYIKVKMEPEKEALEKLKEVRPNEDFNIRCGGNTEIEFLIEERKRNGGGSFQYDDTLYIIDEDGSVTTKNVGAPKYDTSNDAWPDVVKIGTLYDDGKIKGIVASVDENNEPHLIMSLDAPKKTINWYEAMEYGKTLKDGWHIPTKEELVEIWRYDGNVSKILNRGLKKYNGVLLDSGTNYWSSTEYSSNRAYDVYTYNGIVFNTNKYYGSLYVRPFASLS